MTKKHTNLVLPRDCNRLFRYGELKSVPTDRDGEPLQGFETAQKGDSVQKFDLENADTSNVKDMSSMFFDAQSFNQDISDWDTSNVEDMSSMFADAKAFNQDISDWNVSNVKYMVLMFSRARSFNQDISGWDTSNVEDMSKMFKNARSFNQDISDWNISNVNNMQKMFYNADSFSIYNIREWDIERIVEALPDTDEYIKFINNLEGNEFEELDQDIKNLMKDFNDKQIDILVKKDLIDESTAIANKI